MSFAETKALSISSLFSILNIFGVSFAFLEAKEYSRGFNFLGKLSI